MITSYDHGDGYVTTFYRSKLSFVPGRDLTYRVCHADQLRTMLQEEFDDIRVIVFCRQMQRRLAQLKDVAPIELPTSTPITPLSITMED